MLSNYTLSAMTAEMNASELAKFENAKKLAAKLRDNDAVDALPLREIIGEDGEVIGVALDIVTMGVGQGWYVPLRTLFTCDDNAEVSQRSLTISRALSILMDSERGLLKFVPGSKTKLNELYQPIRIGYDRATLNSEGLPADPHDFRIIGGRHRRTGVLSMIEMFGWDVDSEEVMDLLIRVEPDVYSAEKIVTDNGSRSVAAAEKAEVKLFVKGVDANTISGLSAAYEAKDIKASDVFARGLALLADRNKVTTPVQFATATVLGTALASALSKTEGVVMPKKAGDIEKLVYAAWEEMDYAVSVAMDAGKTNLTREGKPYIIAALVNALTPIMKEMMKENLASAATAVVKQSNSTKMEDKQSLLKKASASRKSAKPVSAPIPDGLDEVAPTPVPTNAPKSSAKSGKTTATKQEVVAVRRKAK